MQSNLKKEGKIEIFEIVERISILIRAEKRKKCTELGLQLVHLQILDYLQRCNRFSDTPATLTRYLGLTKGTISQSLRVLEIKGYISKTTDSDDKRIIHLSILDSGEKVLKQISASELFQKASKLLSEQELEAMQQVFNQALSILQQANNSQAFGICKTCQHFTKIDTGFYCQLTTEMLSIEDSDKICQEQC